jgi:hypothetical protein
LTLVVDYALFSFWILSEIKPDCFNSEIFPISLIRVCLNENINVNNWNNAKDIWIKGVLKWRKPIYQSTLSLYGSVNGKVLNFFKDYQKYYLNQICSLNCSLNNSVQLRDNTDLVFENFENNLRFIFPYQNCIQCDSIIQYEINLANNPCFIFTYPVLNNTKIEDYPQTINIKNSELKLLWLHYINLQ